MMNSKPICGQCEVVMNVVTIGVNIIRLNRNSEPYEIVRSDLYGCCVCGQVIADAFATSPLALHFEEDFLLTLKRVWEWELVLRRNLQESGAMLVWDSWVVREEYMRSVKDVVPPADLIADWIKKQEEKNNVGTEN